MPRRQRYIKEELGQSESPLALFSPSIETERRAAVADLRRATRRCARMFEREQCKELTDVVHLELGLTPLLQQSGSVSRRRAQRQAPAAKSVPTASDLAAQETLRRLEEYLRERYMPRGCWAFDAEVPANSAVEHGAGWVRCPVRLGRSVICPRCCSMLERGTLQLVTIEAGSGHSSVEHACQDTRAALRCEKVGRNCDAQEWLRVLLERDRERAVRRNYDAALRRAAEQVRTCLRGQE